MQVLIQLSVFALFITPFSFVFGLINSIKKAIANDNKYWLGAVIAAVSLVLMLIGTYGLHS